MRTTGTAVRNVCCFFMSKAKSKTCRERAVALVASRHRLSAFGIGGILQRRSSACARGASPFAGSSCRRIMFRTGRMIDGRSSRVLRRGVI